METTRENNGHGLRAKERMEEGYEMLRERLGDVGTRLESFVRERPGTALLCAVGLGFLVGRLIRNR
jgi:ElaB/YqjD/DUF883 family membrane-anchored ribosome-binding protein